MVCTATFSDDHLRLTLFYLAKGASSALMETFRPETLCDLLRRVALNHPKKGLTFFGGGHNDFISYADLFQQAHANGNKLRAAGIVRNETIILVSFNNHKANVVWTWSVIAAGGIPAILPALSNDDKTRGGQLQNVQNLFGALVILTSRALNHQFVSLGNASIHAVEDIDLPTRKTTAIDGVFGHGAHNANSIAALLFTSGSTGHSKAVEYTHRQLILSAQAKQQLHKLDTSVDFMSWISFDHSANFCELHINAMNLGANQYFVPAADLIHHPDIFFELIGRCRIGYTFTPNSFLAAACKAWDRRSECDQDWDFSSLKVLMVGGEANKVTTLQHANRILRAGGAARHAIKAAYGLSETCSACFYNSETPSWDLEQGNVFATVGKHLPFGLELRLVDRNSNPHRPSEDGRIQLRGDIVFQRYHNNQVATAECMTEDGWFDTGDLGRFDCEGNLVIVGRSKEILILGGNNYSSFELEHAIESREMPGVSQSWVAAFSVWDHQRDTEGVVVAFNPTDDTATDQALLQTTLSSINDAVRMLCSASPLEIIPLPREEMPKSTIGKLSRQKLKNSYVEGRFDKYRIGRRSKLTAVQASAFMTEMQRTLAKLLAEQLELVPDLIGAKSELANFGMNSIDYLRLKRSLEVAIDGMNDPIPMAQFLEAKTLEDLAALAENRRSAQYQPLVTLRADGSKPPLFLFPPGGGEFMVWLPILEHLPDRPVYALRVKGLERVAEGTFEGLEDMLDAYEAAILSARATGPYALVGLCFGGTTAFEVGKRLERRGHTLSFCGGFDNPPDLAHVLRVGRDNMKDFIIDMLAYHKVIRLDEVAELEKRYATTAEREAVLAITADFRDRGLLDAGLTAEKVEAWYRVNSVAYRISREYIPKESVQRYDVIWANPCPTWNIDLKGWEEMVKRWEPFSRDGCEYRWVKGHHFSLLEEENVEETAGALREMMDEREKSLVDNSCKSDRHVVAEDSAVWDLD